MVSVDQLFGQSPCWPLMDTSLLSLFSVKVEDGREVDVFGHLRLAQWGFPLGEKAGQRSPSMER